MKSKKVVSEGRKCKENAKGNARKCLDVVSVFYCTMMEHHAGVPVTKAQEAALHKDGVYTRAKSLGPVL